MRNKMGFVMRLRAATGLLLSVLLLFWLAGAALAEGTAFQEALPQVVPVTFPQGSGTGVPERAKDNFIPSENAYGSDRLSYHDDSLDVQLHRIRLHDTNVTVAFVQVADPAQLKTEQAKPYPSKTTVRASEIAKRVKAVVAINADWFTYHNTGIIYRNGELLRDRPNEEYDGLAIDVNGDLHIIRPMTQEGYEQLAIPILHSFAFGPALVIGGEVQEIVNRKVTYKQRMAIGQTGPLSYVLVAVDGPEQKNSVGLSVPQLAELMHDLGAYTAYNLDGGQSTTMLMGLVKVNGEQPKNIRAVGDIIYFTTAIESAAAGE